MGPANHTWYLFLQATSDLESLNDIEFIGITHWPNHCPEVPQITQLWFTLGMLILRADSCHHPGHWRKANGGELMSMKSRPSWHSHHVRRALRKYTCTWLGREQEIAVSMVWVTWVTTDLFKKTNEWTRVSSQSLTTGSVFRTRILRKDFLLDTGHRAGPFPCHCCQRGYDFPD